MSIADPLEYRFDINNMAVGRHPRNIRSVSTGMGVFSTGRLTKPTFSAMCWPVAGPLPNMGISVRPAIHSWWQAMTQETTTVERSREGRAHVKLWDHPVTIYFILVFAVAWAGCFAVIGPKLMRGEAVPFSDVASAAIPMFLAPTLMGVTMTVLADGKAGLRELSSRMRRWRIDPRWYASLFIFPMMILASLLPLSVLVSSDFTPYIFLPGIVIGLMAGYFEEIGWTGFAFPRLRSKYGALGGALVIGLLQTTWHVAADFMGAYGARGAYWLPHFILFMISMMAMRVLLVWVYVNTGSVLAAQLVHASSTGFLSVLVPLSLSPAQDTLFYGVYSVALWCVAALVILVYGMALQKQRQPIPAGLRPEQDKTGAGRPDPQARIPFQPARSRP
jgi:membrane protease YdiL (CAAX protease family)